MTDDPEPQVTNLPVPLALAPAAPAPAPLDKVMEAVLAALSPAELALAMRQVFGIVNDSESDPARVAAAKLIFDRLVPKEDLEQKRREAEERDDAVAEIRGILAEVAAAKLAGLSQPPALDPDGPPGADDAPDHGA